MIRIQQRKKTDFFMQGVTAFIVQRYALNPFDDGGRAPNDHPRSFLTLRIWKCTFSFPLITNSVYLLKSKRPKYIYNWYFCG